MNVIENAKEKLSSGFGVTKIKTDITRAHFPNSWCNQPSTPYKDRVKISLKLEHTSDFFWESFLKYPYFPITIYT